MSVQTWQEAIAVQPTAGTLFNTYTTAKTVLAPTGLVSLPPNYLTLGRRLRVTAIMGISNIVTAQPTFTFQVMMGSIVAWTSGAITSSTTAHTTIPAKLVVDLRVNAVGSGTSANFFGQGVLQGIMWTVGANADPTTYTANTMMCPNTAAAAGTGFDSTIANVLDFWVGISASNAANGVQVNEYYVEALN